MKTILVIDDERQLTELLVEDIEDNGFRAIAAFNAESAIKKIAVQKPDVIVCDYNLGDIKGDVVLKRIRDEDKNIPFIMMMSGLSNHSEEEVLALGANKIVSKPIDTADLLLIIKELLPK